MDIPTVDVKQILYATDLSEPARMAFAYAASLSNLYRARLTILHVIPEDPELDERVSGYVSADEWNDIKRRHFQEARTALIGKQSQAHAVRDVLNQFCRGLDTQLADQSFAAEEDILVEIGSPADEIVRVCGEKNCDLIVMGTHGYGAIKDAIMGGTARKVLRRAHVPVLLVPLTEEVG